MFTWFHKLASPPYFYKFAQNVAPWTGWITLLLLAAGLYGGLWLAPPDYQQGDGFRIIYIHVPSAWMSMSGYAFMAIAAGIGLIWRMKLASAVAAAAAPLGASFAFLALVTGSLWGKPMWGTYWVWDARLTSELILLFLYFGFMALNRAFSEQRTGDRASAILALVGLVNLPIIHYSVVWWNTLHQGPTVFVGTHSDISMRMLVPLLVMIAAFMLYFATFVMKRLQFEIIRRERSTAWIRELL
ncbi:MAG TPA: heme ABC transporter permease CcmC [Gammaproteobacteria bacterium]|nr:heme ABC transporter permease CcmC [Gammaproteobacteria bacterium]